MAADWGRMQGRTFGLQCERIFGRINRQILIFRIWVLENSIRKFTGESTQPQRPHSKSTLENMAWNGVFVRSA
eukprot:6006731-Amphidinium_carterae.1